MPISTSSVLRAAGQVLLGGFLIGTGTWHLTFKREEFQAQVPQWVPLDTDGVVLASGVVEIGLGSTLLTAWQQPTRAIAGATTAAFLAAVFPGNIAQYRNRIDALGLDSDRKRAIRLVFQPLGVAAALAATRATTALRAHPRTSPELITP